MSTVTCRRCHKPIAQSPVSGQWWLAEHALWGTESALCCRHEPLTAALLSKRLTEE